jgi:hypothetical protein
MRKSMISIITTLLPMILMLISMTRRHSTMMEGYGKASKIDWDFIYKAKDKGYT